MAQPSDRRKGRVAFNAALRASNVTRYSKSRAFLIAHPVCFDAVGVAVELWAQHLCRPGVKFIEADLWLVEVLFQCIEEARRHEAPDLQFAGLLCRRLCESELTVPGSKAKGLKGRYQAFGKVLFPAGLTDLMPSVQQVIGDE